MRGEAELLIFDTIERKRASCHVDAAATDRAESYSSTFNGAPHDAEKTALQRQGSVAGREAGQLNAIIRTIELMQASLMPNRNRKQRICGYLYYTQ